MKNPRASFSEPAAQLAGQRAKPLKFGAFDEWLKRHRKQLPDEPTAEDVQTWRRAFMAGAAKNPRTFTGHQYPMQYRLVRITPAGSRVIVAATGLHSEAEATRKARELGGGPYTLEYLDATVPFSPVWRARYGPGEGTRARIEVHNPATGRLQPVSLITDRAKRYRAQNAAAGAGIDRTHCVYCGAKNPRDLDHINGREDDGDPSNLAPACRPCNSTKGAHFARIGAGTLTRQYNPTKAGGAATIGEWIAAVGSIIPHKGAQYAGRNYGLPGGMSTAAAVAMIRATPPEKRSEFGRKLARKHGRGAGRGSQEVPF